MFGDLLDGGDRAGLQFGMDQGVIQKYLKCSGWWNCAYDDIHDEIGREQECESFLHDNSEPRMVSNEADFVPQKWKHEQSHPQGGEDAGENPSS